MLKLKLSEFWRNISIVSSGSMISQIVIVTTIPVLSRIYLPENFGLQSLYLSFSLILGSLFTLKFELPIVFANEEKESIFLIVLTVLFSLLFSFVLLMFFLIFGNQLFGFLGIRNDVQLVLSIVLTTTLIGILSALLQFTNRQKRFKTTTNTNVIQSVSNVAGSILLGIFGFIKFGLIYGYLLGYSFSVVFIAFNNYKILSDYIRDYLRFEDLKETFFKYIDYPKIILPTTIFSILSSQIIPIILQKLYSSEFVGYFAMSNRITLLPSIVIGSAVGSVFRTEVSIMENKNENIRPLFISLAKKMFILGLFIYTVLGILAPWLFSVFLGRNWFAAGVLTRYVVLYAFSLFMVQCFYDILLIKKKYKTYFLIQFSLFITISFSLILGNMLFGQNPFHNVTFMAICVFVVLMISLFVIYRSAE